MKKFLLFVLTLACLAVVVLMAKDEIMVNVKTFKDAFSEVKQWKTLM